MASPDARGEVQTRVFKLLLNPFQVAGVANVFDDPNVVDCCFELPLLADHLDTDPLKNDVTRFLKHYEESVTAVDMFLTKPFDSSFSDIPLVDDTYGTFFPLGFNVDILNRNQIGYELDWRKVLIAHDEGTYQLKAEITTILGAAPDVFDFDYCLGNYTPARANGTIRLFMQNSFILGNRFDPKDRIYFPENWTNSIRVPGFFGIDTSDYEEEVTKFNDGSEHDISNKQTEKFKLTIRHVHSEVHEFIKTEFLQADFKTVTDYNKNNPKRHIDTAIRNPGGYEPTYKKFGTLRSTVEVDVQSYWDNKVKKYC